jgi:hypothetical protein
MCWLLDMHGVELNWSEGMPPFVQKLETDRHLAMDFWALVRSLQRDETTSLGQQQIVAMITTCVRGANPLPWRHDDLAAIDHFTSMLAASDASADSGDNLPAALVVPESEKIRPIAKAWSPTYQNEPELPFIAHDPPQTAKPPVNLGFQPSSSPVMSQSLSHHLDEALSRLELASLELKVHLDNLDNRMSRIEPHLEDITALVTSTLGAGSLRASAPEPSVPATPALDTYSLEASTLEASATVASTPVTSQPVAMPEMSAQRALLHGEIITMDEEFPIPPIQLEPEISFRDRAAKWWAASALARWSENAKENVKAMWANRSQWKSAMPKLPPHLLPDLKRRWHDSTQFVTDHVTRIHRRHIAIASTVLVALFIGRAFFVSGHRHQAVTPVTQKPAQQPTAKTPAVKTVDRPTAETPKDSTPAPIPSVATSPTNVQPESALSTGATIPSQTNAPKKRAAGDYVAKPTFKWLDEPPPKAAPAKVGDSIGTNNAPKAAVLGERSAAPPPKEAGIDVNP